MTVLTLASYRGNRLHAPANTAAALRSAYTSGADILEFDVQLSRDAAPVVVAPGAPGVGDASAHTLLELRAVDLGAGFSVRGSTATPWRQKKAPPLARVETLGAMLDLLPREATLIVRAHAGANAAAAETVRAVAAALERRGFSGRAMVSSDDPEVLGAAKQHAPALRRAFVLAAAQAAADPAAWLDDDYAAVIAPPGLLLDAAGGATPAAATLARRRGEGRLPFGVIVQVDPDAPALDGDHYAALARDPACTAVAVPSLLDIQDVGPVARPMRRLADASFAGQEEDAARFHFGYAKANGFAHVFQDDGVHLEIAPYAGPPAPWTPKTGDPVADELIDLQEASWFATRSWPFYSGGGFGTAFAVDGDFAAEVDFSMRVTCQATMCEMAAVNVDPTKHHPGWRVAADGTRVPNVPQSFRDKDSFFDPHGAPPFVGAEHDEDDGYRINYNLGTEYDHNQYGRPVGDGTTKRGRLRLERRGAHFTAYYKDEQNADWVCAGACENNSLNRLVFIRCAGKRWRQETDPPVPGQPYFPIPDNTIVFSRFSVTTFRDHAARA